MGIEDWIEAVSRTMLGLPTLPCRAGWLLPAITRSTAPGRTSGPGGAAPIEPLAKPSASLHLMYQSEGDRGCREFAYFDAERFERHWKRPWPKSTSQPMPVLGTGAHGTWRVASDDFPNAIVHWTKPTEHDVLHGHWIDEDVYENSLAGNPTKVRSSPGPLATMDPVAT